MDLVSLDQIRAAATLLEPVVRKTPVVASRVLSDRTGVPVHLKCENLQRTGSFKIRGAYTRIHGLTDAERARGVVAASAGNHAQGVALAADLLGARSTVFMPTGAPLPKLAATKAYGAQVHLVGEVLEDALAEAVEFAERTGAVFIHPFDHLDVVAGQGTVGLEIVEQLPDVGTVLVCTGGGGLVAGVAAAVKALKPGVRVVAVQAEQAAAWPGSLAAGHPVRLSSMSTMADGIAVGAPGPVTYAHVSQLVDEVVTVSEDALSRALVLCLERAKMVVEPAGAAAVAALLDGVLGDLEGPVCAVVSGGNVDPLLLVHVVQHGLTAARRFLALRVTVPDRPGSLVGVLTTVSGTGANVIDVAHSRLTGTLALGEVEIAITVETRGAEHCSVVVGALRRSGYVVAEEPVGA
ncbi:threonine ammonia-lyase [Rhodococcus antarcticus]|jgi:threonine dehydratase|uniref:L-threonine dehydratase catabolic TdcB n=1 Tax=Rhodococcus antarcticus TaxID=2987751 RepID=A0ABY6NYI5_9NOCA|nr:threonine ammonia-lyase [Rhodococcus antarcticus]UZJ24058.1 threonine ammonia-lyase [Rhodococcus antarcticus]